MEVEEEIEGLGLGGLVFAGGEIRKDFVEMDDEEVGVDVGTARRFLCSLSSIGSDLTLSVSIEDVLSSCRYCANKSSTEVVGKSPGISRLERENEH